MVDRVLVDTSAFYALVSSEDEFHQRASTVYADLLDQRVALYTTSYVMVECMALIHRRLGFSVLNSFVDSVRGTVTILWVDSMNHWSSWDAMQERQGTSLSFVDWTTVALAKSLDAKLFAFDDDFLREGLEVI
jgi:predicted nucleic acid-binding protein